MSGNTLMNAIFEGALLGTILYGALLVIKTTHEKNVLGGRVKKARDQYEMARDQYEMARDQKMFSLLEENLSQGKS